MTGALTCKPYLHLPDEQKGVLFPILRRFDRIVVAANMGGTFFADEPELQDIEFVKLPPVPEKSYPLKFDEFASRAFAEGAEVIVTVGGDGVASYAATAIIRQGLDMGILGIPAGTANAGPIVRADHSEDSLDWSRRLDSIEVSCAGKVLGYGFNDVILGKSFLGTLDGRLVNLSARAMAQKGEALELADPDITVAGKDFSVVLNGQAQEVPSVGDVKQICVSTLHQDRLMCRAIFGGLLESTGMEAPAAIALLDKNVTDARPGTWSKKMFRRTAHLCFGAGDTVEIEGLADGVCVIIDGNPFVLEDRRITVRCVPDSVKVFGIGG